MATPSPVAVYNSNTNAVPVRTENSLYPATLLFNAAYVVSIPGFYTTRNLDLIAVDSSGKVVGTTFTVPASYKMVIDSASAASDAEADCIEITVKRPNGTVRSKNYLAGYPIIPASSEDSYGTVFQGAQMTIYCQPGDLVSACCKSFHQYAHSRGGVCTLTLNAHYEPR